VDHKIWDAYKIFGLTAEASKEDVSAAYRKLASEYHPDKVAHLGDALKEVALKKMKEINWANDILKKCFDENQTFHGQPYQESKERTHEEVKEKDLPKSVRKQRKYEHQEPTNHEEAVAWLVREAQTSDILVALAKELAHGDNWNRFERFFVPRKFSQEERRLTFNIRCNILANEARYAGGWEWIDVFKDAFLVLGDKTNAKKVEDAIIAEFGKGQP